MRKLHKTNLTRLAALEDKATPCCVVYAMPKKDGTWTVNGCWGRFSGLVVDAKGLAALDADPTITTLVVYEIYQELENEREI